MRCGNCNLEFTLKEQAKAKGCCPSCGEKLPASAYCDDDKAWLWYQYRSPMPFSVMFGYIYLVGGGLLALMIMPVLADCGQWGLIASVPIFLLPFFALFFMPSARKWRAESREDAVVYKAAVKSGKLSLCKYRMVVAMIGLIVTALGLFCCLSAVSI